MTIHTVSAQIARAPSHLRHARFLSSKPVGAIVPLSREQATLTYASAMSAIGEPDEALRVIRHELKQLRSSIEADPHGETAERMRMYEGVFVSRSEIITERQIVAIKRCEKFRAVISQGFEGVLPQVAADAMDHASAAFSVGDLVLTEDAIRCSIKNIDGIPAPFRELWRKEAEHTLSRLYDWNACRSGGMAPEHCLEKWKIEASLSH